MTTSPLDAAREALVRYVVMPSPEATDAVTLWIAATHVQPALYTAPRLVISSPEKRCGKSRLLDVIEGLCHDPLMAFNATYAAIVRSIDADDPPTLLFDEADAIWPVAGSSGGGAENLRAMLNAGFNRGRPVIRCSGAGSSQTVVRLPSFAMAALAGIGYTIPDTITDRAVNIRMRRRASHESADPLRSADMPALQGIGSGLGAWLGAHLTELSTAKPVMTLTDRAADVWEPLMAVADLAGGRWPYDARIAAMTLHEAYTTAEDASGPGALLSAIRDAFAGQTRVSTADLVSATGAVDGAALASVLRAYGIAPRTLRLPTGARLKGYVLDDFADTFDRYLGTAVTSVTG
jgi:hypothetical protein